MQSEKVDNRDTTTPNIDGDIASGTLKPIDGNRLLRPARRFALRLLGRKPSLAMSLMALLLLIFVFNCTPAVIRSMDLRGGYGLKQSDPFADPLTDPGILAETWSEGHRSHFGKLNVRVVGSVMVYLQAQLGLHPMTFATLGGILLLMAMIKLGRQFSGDSWSGFWVAAVVAGLFAMTTSLSAMPLNPFPYDGIALGFVALGAMCWKRSWLLVLFTLLACWADERAGLAAMLLAITCAMHLRNRGEGWKAPIVAVIAAGVLFIGTRLVFDQVTNYERDSSMVGTSVVLKMAPYFLHALWLPLEGGWILLGAALLALVAQRQWRTAVLIAVVVIGSAASTLVALDLSRSGAFLFPLVLLAVVACRQAKLSRRTLRRIAAIAAAVALICPTYDLSNGKIARWAYPLPAQVVKSIADKINSPDNNDSNAGTNINTEN